MCKYLRVNLVVAVLLCLVGFIAMPLREEASAVGATTFYVAATGSVGAGSSCTSPGYVGATNVPIQAALNAASTGDTVFVCAGTYAISTRLEVTKTLTLTGAGAATTIFDGGGNTQILIVQDGNINDGASGDEITATISNLSFVNGNATDFLGDGSECTDGNRCGGGIFVENESVVNISNVHFKNNKADFIGGGFARFIGNWATVPSVIENSSFESNLAGFDGGAVATLFGFGLTINRSTFYQNGLLPTWNARSGAAIIANFANATINDSTIVDHEAPAGITVLYGGLTLNRTLVAQVGGSTTNICNNQQTVDGARGNLVTDSSCVNVTQDKATAGAGNSAVVSTSSLKLGTFAYRGYATKSIPLLAGSSALDHGLGCAGNDQVGTSTPQGAACDIGAVERPTTQSVNTIDVSTWSYGGNTLYRDAASPVALVSAPTDAAGRGVSYSTSTPAVCTVNSTSGALTLVADGTCTLTASSPDYQQRDGSSANKTLTVAATTPTTSSSSTSSSTTSTTSTTVPPTTTSVAPSTATTTAAAPSTATTTATSVVPPVSDTAPPESTLVQSTSRATKTPLTTVAVGQSQIVRITTTTGPLEVGNGSDEVVTSTTVTGEVPEPMADTLGGPEPPAVPTASPGEAAVDVGGRPVEMTLSRANDQLVVETADLSATISGVGGDGVVTALDNDGVLRLVEGDQIQIETVGFAPGSEVEVWLFSTPMLLGTIGVGANTNAVGSFPLPEGIESGRHRIALVGSNSKGEPTSLAVGVLVGSSTGGVGTVGKVLIIAPIALAVFAALVLPARRRRKVAVR